MPLSQSHPLLTALARARWIKDLVPVRLKRLARGLLPLDIYDPIKWSIEDPCPDAPQVSDYPGRVPVRLGIIKEFTGLHGYYVLACRELGVPYRIVDISGPDWLEQIQSAGCDAFLIRPSGARPVWKQMYDERLKVIVQDLGKVIFPSLEEIWLYESKRRMYYWLAAHGIPHPRTWVFYDRHQALDFAGRCRLPIVFKSDFGSGSKGVRVIRSRSVLARMIRQCFEQGFAPTGAYRGDSQHGSVLFQQYLPQVREWRIIRIAQSYLGYQKLRRGDYHSGSHCFGYGRPPTPLLRMAKTVTDTGGFLSMALDCFVTGDGQYMVNELQTTFGLHADRGLPIEDGRVGRLVYDPNSDDWVFEQGDFCRNNLCNLRVQALVQRLLPGGHHHWAYPQAQAGIL